MKDIVYLTLNTMIVFKYIFPSITLVYYIVVAKDIKKYYPWCLIKSIFFYNAIKEIYIAAMFISNIELLFQLPLSK